ncbi:MAG TPA: HlyD family secretion protein [Gemmatimonadales bacterium]|nr:HlyD family secretion protein [Gemmatimonadales bacterium]
MVEIGDPVAPLGTYQEGTVLLTMAEMSDLLFRGTVDEIDVGKLKEGMPVVIKIGALPDARVDGRVAKISLKARKQDNATAFPVEIALVDTHPQALLADRAGMRGNAHRHRARRGNPACAARGRGRSGGIVEVRVGATRPTCSGPQVLAF